MTIRRYNNARSSTIKGMCYATSKINLQIRSGIASGVISYTSYITKESERLDTLAGQFYGDGRLWWIIAAASQIGWGVQMPPNTSLRIPKLDDIAKFFG
jgi:nucleoid-associated protein YgaU